MLKSIPTDQQFSHQKERELSHKVHHKKYITEKDDFNNYIPMKLVAKIKPKKLNFNNNFQPNKEINFGGYEDDSSRNEQAVIMRSDLIPLPPSIVNVSKSLCKVYTPFARASGFLIRLFKGGEEFFCLMSNEHVINKKLIEQQAKIKIKYDGENKYNEFHLKSYRRFIRHFRDMGIDATIVEILPEVNISRNYFLYPNLDYMQNFNKLINNYITILQYPKGKLSYASGKIIGINGYEFSHLVSTKAGSSGSPIFLKDTTTVIGIHKSESRNYEKNYADFIGPIFYYLRNLTYNVKVRPINAFNYGNLKFNKKSKLKLKLNPHFSHDTEKDKRVIKLLPDINNFVNDRNEVYGKYIYENGEFYIGQWKNGLRNGKGTLHNKIGTIQYEGYRLNDKREGKGIRILDDGSYYKGYYKNNSRNGKGKLYKRDGNIIMENGKTT